MLYQSLYSGICHRRKKYDFLNGGYTIRNSFTNTIGTITNLLGIVLVTIYQKGKYENWENTIIKLDEGVVEAKDQFMNSIFANELITMMESVNGLWEKYSEKQ